MSEIKFRAIQTPQSVAAFEYNLGDSSRFPPARRYYDSRLALHLILPINISLTSFAALFFRKRTISRNSQRHY